MERVKRRVEVSFTSEGRSGIGFTSNLSRGGVLMRSAVIFVPGTQLTGKLELGLEAPVSFAAEVAWAKRVRTDDGSPPAQSMGLRFVQPPPEEYLRYLAHCESLHRELPSVAVDGRGTATMTMPQPGALVSL